jgi:hypothetical protein
MYSKEDVVDLHKWADVGVGMTAVVFVMDFARGEEEDIVDGVETESQNLELITQKKGKH